MSRSADPVADLTTNTVFDADAAELWTTTVQFARQELAESAMRARDRSGEFWREGWRRCAAYGVQRLPVPADHGGLALSMLHTVVVLDALGYACDDAGLIFSINAHLWGSVVPLWLHGTPEQRRRYLGPLMAGELIGGHAMTEPSSGSDAFSLRTRARPQGQGFVLDGAKTFSTNAPIADIVVVFARIEGTEGPEGISAFIVERGTPGLTTGTPFDKMGLRTSPLGELALDGCVVGPEAVLGPVGGGAAVFNSSMLWERTCIVAPLVGAMQRTLERCVSYARTRRQFGKSIGRFESISAKVADMKVAVDTSRSIVRRAAQVIDSGPGGLLEASVSKLYVSEAAVGLHREALQLHGGYGYMTDYEIERGLRDVLASTIYSGTSEMQRHIIGRLMGL